MQVWIFNPFDDVPNEGKPQRFYALAEALVAQGHSVVWWSSDFSHRRKAARRVRILTRVPFGQLKELNKRQSLYQIGLKILKRFSKRLR